MGKKAKKGWLGKVSRSMEKRGTQGAFTRSAKAAGKSVQEYADSVLANPRASLKQKRRAAFAKAMKTIAARRKGKR